MGWQKVILTLSYSLFGWYRTNTLQDVTTALLPKSLIWHDWDEWRLPEEDEEEAFHELSSFPLFSLEQVYYTGKTYFFECEKVYPFGFSMTAPGSSYLRPQVFQLSVFKNWLYFVGMLNSISKNELYQKLRAFFDSWEKKSASAWGKKIC